MMALDGWQVKEALKLLEPVAKRGGKEVAIQRNIHLSAQGREATLRASDRMYGDVALTLPADRDGRRSFRPVLIHPRTLKAALAPVTKKGGQTLKLSEAEGDLRFSVGAARFEVNVADVRDAEQWGGAPVAEQPWFTVRADALADLLGDVAIAVSTDDSRPVLCAVKLSVERNMLDAVATDTYRLAHARAMPEAVTSPGATALLQLLTLRKLLLLLKGTAPDSLVSAWATGDGEATALAFAAEQWCVRGECAEGVYVKYKKRVTPWRAPRGGFKHAYRMDVAELREALAPIVPVAKQDANRAVMSFSTGECNLRATCYNPKMTVTSAAIPAEALTDDPELETAYDVRYLLDYLERVGQGKVTMEVGGPLHASRWQCRRKRGKYVLMPMQVM